MLIGLGGRVRDNNVKDAGFAALPQAMHRHVAQRLVTDLLQVRNDLTSQNVCTVSISISMSIVIIITATTTST